MTALTKINLVNLHNSEIHINFAVSNKNKSIINKMAAIDKIYIDSFVKYNIFKEWCRLQPKIKDKYGKETSLINYVFSYNEWKDGAVLPVCNNPYYIDAYLIRYCPFDFIQKELMLNYGKWDQDMIDELDYEYKKAHKPYDKYERHWDEA